MSASTLLLAILMVSSSIGRVLTGHKETLDRPLNILLTTIQSRGHINPMLRLSKILIARGHNVTYMTGADESSFSSVQTLISSYNITPSLFKTDQLPFLNLTRLNKAMKSGMLSMLKNMILDTVEKTIQHFNQTLQGRSFDLVIGNEFLVAPLMCINSGWNIPVVLVGCTMPSLFISQQPYWPWPGLLLAEASDHLSFLQRHLSLVETIIVKQIVDYFVMYPQYLALHKFCPAMTPGQLYDAPGVYLPHIVQTVIGFEYPRTMTPLTSYVGPIFPNDLEPLSQDPKLKKWLDTKPERSVVYLSMGSILLLEKEVARSILEGVTRTRYFLLWSFKNQDQKFLEDLNIDEERVFISRWTPQFSVLESKAIHCAILHGGFNGLNEALWNGVPVIGLPQTPEQSLNVGRLLHNKYGLRLNSASITSTEVEEAIRKLEKDEYRTNIRKLKKMFQLAGGINRTAELIEFYGREGYSHLIPAYAKYQWSWIEFHNADAWLNGTILLLLLALGIYKSFKLLMKVFCRKLKQKIQ